MPYSVVPLPVIVGCAGKGGQPGLPPWIAMSSGTNVAMDCKKSGSQTEAMGVNF